MQTSERILSVAMALIEEAGTAGLTTRAVCDRAGITAPTLYHHFGDKEGLLRAAMERGMSEFLAMKGSVSPGADALEDLKQGWNGWTEFALQRPNLFRLMADVIATSPSATRPGYDLLYAVIERIAREGRLLTDVETAARTVWAGSYGVMTLFIQGADANEIRSSADLLIDALIGRLVLPAH